MAGLRHGPPLAMNGFMDKEGRKLRARKTRYFKLKDSALFNHRRKDSVRFFSLHIYYYVIIRLLSFLPLTASNLFICILFVILSA